MRKKPVKSTSVGSDLKRRIVKKQQGGVASYINVNEPVLQYKNWIELPDVFSEYNLPTKIKLQNEEPKPEAVKYVDTKEEKPKTESEKKPVKQNAFINGLRPIIEQTLKRRGLDTKWTDHLVAQAALESGWGKSESGKFNLSGIKGKGSEKNTKEYINGKMVNTRDSFRDYKDYNDWADNYINLLSNKRYGKAWTLSEDQFMPYIINAGYATDPNYISKYNKVLAEVKKYEDGGRIRRFQNGKPIKVDKSLLRHTDPRLLNPSESTRINNPYIKEKALKPTQKVDPERFEIESMIPFIGDAADINNVGSDFSSGNYGAAALGAGLLLLPNAIEKPLKVAGKAIKQGVKKYGTKAANKVENIAPKASDWFHTWNAKDNIKHATFDDVVNAKKSRMAHNVPKYTWDDVESMVNEWAPTEELRKKYGNSLYEMAYKVLPDPITRQQKLATIPKESTNEEILKFIVRDPKVAPIVHKIGSKNALDRYSDDILKSFSGVDDIHVGTKRYNEFLMPWDKDFYKGKPESQFNIGTTYAHEFDHYMGNPSLEEVKKIDEIFTLEGVHPSRTGYFTREHRSDLKARMGQFKDLYLLTGKNPISPSQARVAAKMYSNPDKYKLIPNMIDLKTNFSKIDYSKLSNLMNSLSLKNGGKL